MPQRHSLEAGQAGPLPFHDRALVILWPAFVMAAVLEALVFVVVDPASLNWFGVEPLGWTTSSVYSVTFLIFWGVISTSAAITQLLHTEGPHAEHV
jgi:hypothetical protein